MENPLISRREHQESTICHRHWINTHELPAQRFKRHSYRTCPSTHLRKLIKRIERGNFIEMAELLPESLGHITDEDQPAVPKFKRRPVSDIVEWLQCFGAYIAIVSRKQPTRVIDLLGYQKPYHSGIPGVPR